MSRHDDCAPRLLQADTFEVGEFRRGGPADPVATRCGMTKVTNLRLARKRAAREKAAAKAAENRVAHGASKAERHRANAERESGRRKLDQHRVETGVRR
jgi:hypothetical protein